MREREVRAAIDAGATRPAEVFRHKGCQAQCAKCVCEMRQMIQDNRQALAYAAE
ncbi:MAG: ferredoxin [Caulobacter sp.]|nr:ferredoxin [Caulobacter sp.]